MNNTLMDSQPSMCLFKTPSSARSSAVFQFGMPFKKGQFFNLSELGIVSANNGQWFTSHMAETSKWPDKSLKWVMVAATLPTNAQFAIKPIEQNETVGKTYSHCLVLQDNKIACLENGSVIGFEYSSAETETDIQVISQLHGLHGNVETLTVSFTVSHLADIQLFLAVDFCHHSKQSQISLRIENKRAAIHDQGTWDLGDLNSEQISKLNLSIAFNQLTSKALYLTDDLTNTTDVIQNVNGILSQFSSGGENWQSPVHQNQQGEVTLSKQGYEFNGDQQQYVGKRAKPRYQFDTSTGVYWVCPNAFWQNFPSTIATTDNGIHWGLFPSSTELQPGESKQWALQITPADQLLNKDAAPDFEALQVQFDIDYLNDCRVFTTQHLASDNAFSELIQRGVEGPTSFFHKRETCDEYGWRNYGELYADHEALNKPSTPIFVSHYNNQYDTILGTTVQSLCHPSTNWQDIANPLAQHVQDIDIYNTDGDKPEYNGGLFWHTDHYLPAETCTHRTYSKKHTSVYDGHQGGGGPGGQHCYTSGLLMRALLNNDTLAATKVTQLTQWIRQFYNGNNSLLGRLHRFLTIDLKPNQLTNIGIIQKGYRYPLDRGTGNYLNALIDCFELTADRALLREQAYVIQNTVGLGDDLNHRQLDDTENSWFYTVFLQAVIKYLLLKESLEENDTDYAYARALLAKFGEWMLQHEVPYLSTPEKLEFPTDTWAAQDVRKAIIFAYLAYFDGTKQSAYLEKADYFTHYVESKLSASPEASTTRILAILMQNYGAIERAKLLAMSPISPVKLPNSLLSFTGTPALMRLIKDKTRILIRFSISEELRWLRSRLGTTVVNRGARHD